MLTEAVVKAAKNHLNHDLMDQINVRQFEEVFFADVMYVQSRDVFVVHGALKTETDDFPMCYDFYEVEDGVVGNLIHRRLQPCECA